MNDNLTPETPPRSVSIDKRESYYACIQDLVDNGLDLNRFTAKEVTPSRQDITQYLAAWCRHAGQTDEECRGWLIDYCVNVLSVLSRRSAAAIRHSTKSNVKYIYGSNVQFVCEHESNPFKAHCSKSCPYYSDPNNKKVERPDPLHRIVSDGVQAGEIYDHSVKGKFKDQFEEALKFIRSQIELGTKRPKIVDELNERGFKSKTGRPWTYSKLSIEISNAKKSSGR